MQSKKFTLDTREGCRRLLAILLGAVLLFSFLAQLISSDAGKVKVSALTIDARGAELSIDQYVPAGVSDADSLPCVLLAHGRGATKNVLRGIAEELARRGFVVLNVSSYGMGLSEQPVSDEAGDGADHFNFGDSPIGMLDALDYARSLKFVDSTRIAMYGHSYGSSRISVAAAMDCGYYTLNDIKLNILADTFQQSFSADEITQDADTLAADRLNKDQLAYYTSLSTAAAQTFSSRLSTIVLTGATGGPQPATVKVAGQEVTRECQVNVTFIDGKYDSLGAGAAWKSDGTQTILGDGSLKSDFWYASQDNGASFAPLGALGDISITDSTALADAIASRTARIVCFNAESHSQNYGHAEKISNFVRSRRFPAERLQ